MKFKIKNLVIYLSVAFLIASTVESGAFALLGPVQPWMQTSNGVIFAGDIGGPMDISNGYRWNVPVVTYGFDQSFLNYFGSNGVAAVESAIKILNDLPPASQMMLTNYPSDSRQVNYAASAQSLYDLKSQTLSLLLEHLGLVQPTRNIYALKQWTPMFIEQNVQDSWASWAIPDYIVQRNFDPQTLLPTTYINHILYFGIVYSDSQGNYMYVMNVDPRENSYTAVADFSSDQGLFYTGLTYDDVGGLAYLLSTNSVNYENLLPGIVGIGTNANTFVNGAWRPGVDKITFLPQPVGMLPGTFLLTTNYFTDRYLTNGILHQQQMSRIIVRPDIVFSVGDVTIGIPALPFFTRTGTTNWLNNAMANGNTNGEGPGVIQPHVQIVFSKLGPLFNSGGPGGEEVGGQLQFWGAWGSFSGSTNVPIVYPISQASTNQLTVRMWLERGTYPSWSTSRFDWNPTNALGTIFMFQTSTNLTAWVDLFSVTNDGSVCTYFNRNPASPSRFYRLMPQ